MSFKSQNITLHDNLLVGPSDDDISRYPGADLEFSRRSEVDFVDFLIVYQLDFPNAPRTL